MTPDAKVARAQRWQAFYDEPGGIGDMLARVTQSLMAEAVACEPWETDKLKKVALGMKIAGLLDGAVKGVLIDGQLAEHANATANRIANIPEHKKRWL